MNTGWYLHKSLNGSLAETGRVLLNRDRVLALDEGLPVLVVEGPSGYGKTSLAEMWLERQRSTASCCWVALDVTSCDPVRFLEQLPRAVGADYPGKQEAGMDDEAGRAERFSHLCARLAEDSASFRVVVDDAYLIAHSSSRLYLERLLDLSSSNLRICVTMQPIRMDVGLG